MKLKNEAPKTTPIVRPAAAPLVATSTDAGQPIATPGWVAGTGVSNPAQTKPAVSTPDSTPPKPIALTPFGVSLKRVADAAASVPMGPLRAEAFGKTVLPILLQDAGRLLNVDPSRLEAAMARVVQGSGSEAPTLGLKRGEKGLELEPYYPPRAANAVWADFAQAAGISAGDAAAVTELNVQLGALPRPSGIYAPEFGLLSPELQRLSTRVAQSLLGEELSPPLNSIEYAFQASLVLNNLTWHAGNWQKAATDPTRVDPQERKNVFNTYSDNLRFARDRGGLSEVIDMALADGCRAGKPGVGKAEI